MASRSFKTVAVVGMYTETPLHCGAESGLGYVDLPIQRERHTGYPVIPGSSLKGRLKDELKKDLGDAQSRLWFGARVTDESEDGETKETTVPGSISFGDGQLVAFPVRSTGAPFHWVTCGFALERLLRAMGEDASLAGPTSDEEAWGVETSEVVLEEAFLQVTAQPATFADTGPAAKLLQLLPGADRGFQYTRSIFLKRLLVVSDALFKELVETATDVVTRIKLTALKTTTKLAEGAHPEITDPEEREGNLFVEELVPPETLFFCSLRAQQPDLDVRAELPAMIQLGGDETIGRGVTHLTVVASPGAEDE